MKNNTAICFADAGKSVGSGHIFRVAPVVQALRKLGVSVAFFSAQATGRRLVRGEQAINPSQLPKLLSAMKCKLLLMDSYHGRREILRAAGDSVQALFDDHYTDVPDVNVLINASPTATPDRYKTGIRSRKLLGPSFSCLHPAFRTARSGYLVRKDVKRIFVALGGNDTGGNLPALIDSLSDVVPGAIFIVCGSPDAKLKPSPHMRRRKWLSQSQIGAELAGCDLAILAGGQMLQQAACIGVPVISLPQTPNQHVHARSWQKIGSVQVVNTTAEIPRVLKDLSRFAVRKKMFLAGRKTVDGLGAMRVAKALTESLHGDH